ncbi:MAG: cellobiose phosphorylase [Bacilli bacterium]|nr:cellobiose phosphorylase [Bacilli bacterium]
MFPKQQIKTYLVGSEELNAKVLESGNIQEIRSGINRINTYVSNNLEPSIANLYIRVDGKFSRMIGIDSPSKVLFTHDEVNNYVVYIGSFEGVQYHIIFSIIENALLFDVRLDKVKGKVVEVFYGLDVSISNIYAISNNEAYVSQYIDHKAYLDNDGYTLCSRQNQGDSLYLESSTITKNVSYDIDGFQFFGKDYKFNNLPICLSKSHLDNEIYQYEFAYHALQSEKINLDKDARVVFYSYYSASHPDAISKPLYKEKVLDIYKKVENRKYDFSADEFKKIDLKISYDDILEAEDIDVDEMFPNRHLEEKIDGRIMSFFLDDKSHVVLSEKERYIERPSGNIIYSQNKFEDGSYDFENVIATTGYIFGLFNSQIVCGNTSFNKLLSNLRNPLNVQKISGQRIFINIDGKYRLLGMPSAFVMGINYLKWIYKLKEDTLEIKTYVSFDTSKVELEFKSLKGIKYDLVITNHLVMGEREHESLVHVSKEDLITRIMFDHGSMTYNKYPDLFFKMGLSEDYEISDDRVFYLDNLSRDENLLTFRLKSNGFKMFISSSHTDDNHLDFEKDTAYYLEKVSEFVNGFNIKGTKQLESYNYLVYWYAHDALCHYLTPHGLEQYSGAAWGTRDVCQGPAELFLSMHKYDRVRNIILDVYKHQFLENGNFPQWFMFDKFYNIQDLTSHGDIIVWPLRLVALYLEATDDYSILDELVPYTSMDGIKYTSGYSIKEHILKEIKTIEDNFISGTKLSCYGGGDWDDTLQPANSDHKKEMVSGWTTSLTYEAFTRLGNKLDGVDASLSNKLLELAKGIKEDYNKLVIKDGVPAGFIHFRNDGIDYIIHPSDKESGIKYRLLPLTRGIISEMFDEKQAINAAKIVDDNLTFPDGARLMSDAVKYNGGIKTYFNRAETAANFGREIGLQYCHANVRYLEAMHKLGLSCHFYDGLNKINPIIVTDVVKNALPRQRNSYFSSSDGCFNTRYIAKDNFNKLKTGEVGVKGGWRVYSSGPGIYLNALTSNFLGIKEEKNKVILDPVIPSYLDDFSLEFRINNKKVIINYHLNKTKKKIIINGDEIDYVTSPNIYRSGGFVFDKSLINKEENIIDVYLENELINKEIKGCFDFFWNESGDNGLTLDKIFSTSKRYRASTAGIGFGLAAIVVAAERGLVSKKDAKDRVRVTIDSLLKMEDFHGLLPHFVDPVTGINQKSEFSTIDTAILLMGAITAASYFKGDIEKDVKYLVNRVDWDHFVTIKDGKKVIKMAYSYNNWKDTDGYCPATWDHYAEQLMIYYLYAAKDSTTKQDSLDLYHGFKRHIGSYKGNELVHCYGNALFIHQFTHCFIDFRGLKTDDNINWFKNSIDATLANRQYCIDQTWSKTYKEDSWGLSAFQGQKGYMVYGAPPWGFDKPIKQELDGSVAPYAALSSIVFTPKESLKALEYFNLIEGLNKLYGICECYNFDTGYISDCYIGIDKGPTIIMLDNFQNETVWKYFMCCDMTKKALEKLDFIKGERK